MKPQLIAMLSCLTLLGACEKAQEKKPGQPVQQGTAPSPSESSPSVATPPTPEQMLPGTGSQSADGTLDLSFDVADIKKAANGKSTPDRWRLRIEYSSPANIAPYEANGSLAVAADKVHLTARSVPVGDATLKLTLSDAKSDLFNVEKPVSIVAQTNPISVVLSPIDHSAGSTWSGSLTPITGSGSSASTQSGTTSQGTSTTGASGAGNSSAGTTGAGGAGAGNSGQTSSNAQSSAAGDSKGPPPIWRGESLLGRDGWSIEFGTNN